MFIISIVAVGLLWLISVLHIYWAFGGRWGTEAVIPMKEGSQQAVLRRENGERSLLQCWCC